MGETRARVELALRPPPTPCQIKAASALTQEAHEGEADDVEADELGVKQGGLLNHLRGRVDRSCWVASMAPLQGCVLWACTSLPRPAALCSACLAAATATWRVLPALAAPPGWSR